MRLPIIRRQSGVRAAGERRYAFDAEIPGRRGDRPLWRLKIELLRRPQGTGESLRVRAHLQARPAQALGLKAPARKRSALIVGQEFNHWLELRASTADLAQAADDLLPEKSRLRDLGVVPRADGPAVQTWAGRTAGAAPGYAQISLLQLDKRRLPRLLALLLGARPFQLAAALVSVIEPERE
jgi:hypothetical protein